MNSNIKIGDLVKLKKEVYYRTLKNDLGVLIEKLGTKCHIYNIYIIKTQECHAFFDNEFEKVI